MLLLVTCNMPMCTICNFVCTCMFFSNNKITKQLLSIVWYILHFTRQSEYVCTTTCNCHCTFKPHNITFHWIWPVGWPYCSSNLISSSWFMLEFRVLKTNVTQKRKVSLQRSPGFGIDLKMYRNRNWFPLFIACLTNLSDTIWPIDRTAQVIWFFFLVHYWTPMWLNNGK